MTTGIHKIGSCVPGLLLRPIVFVLGIVCSCSAVASDLSERIDSILAGKRMTVGVAAEWGGGSFVHNDSLCFPLMSVFKTHVAMAVAARMKTDGFGPDSVVHIAKSRLLPGTYSPLRQKYPDRDVDITISELLRYSVAESDNNACDVLIDIAGGADYVDMYIRSLGITGFSISETEASMHEAPASCRNNWSRPSSMLGVLKKIFEPGDNPFGLLREIMKGTVTGADKIRAGVPGGVPVAHKTGSSGRSDGVKTADNDAGVVFLPQGRCYVVVFIMDSAETDAENAATIAAITREIVAEASSASR